LITLATEVDVAREAGRIRGRRRVPGGFELLEVSAPAVVSVKTASNEPRFMDFRLKSRASEAGQVTIWNADDLGCDLDRIGPTGSPTQVTGLRQARLRERRREILGGPPDEVAHELLGRIREVLPGL
jgi:electron transfer flavoprotein alpha/beta subunit